MNGPKSLFCTPSPLLRVLDSRHQHGHWYTYYLLLLTSVFRFREIYHNVGHVDPGRFSINPVPLSTRPHFLLRRGGRFQNTHHRTPFSSLPSLAIHCWRVLYLAPSDRHPLESRFLPQIRYLGQIYACFQDVGICAMDET